MEDFKVDKSKIYVNPIATPLAGDKLERKLLRLTKKVIQLKGVKRGVKEVGKAIRKNVEGIVIFAADVSPPDVISHLPIQCERKGLPYIFVKSRVELGLAASTKRPTSVIMLTLKNGGGNIEDKFNKLKERIAQYN